MIKILSKRGYEFSFAWIFAIFVGAVIIFLAIYFTIQIIGTQQATRDVTQSKSLGVLLTPIETELEEGKFAKIYLTDPTRIYFECKEPTQSNPFGSQNLRLSIKPPLGQRWEDAQSPAVTFHNKYFFPSGELNYFDETAAEGEKEFYVLSKPLYLPFKVADLMIIYSDKQKFCFSNINQAPSDFRRRMEQINMTNVIFAGCNPDEHEVICFGSRTSGCDIVVNENQKTVMKGSKTVSYAESSVEHDPYAMLYAAIFSDPDTYTCQVKRLMSHASKLTDIYYSKSNYINCGEAVRQELQSLNNTFASTQQSGIVPQNLNILMRELQTGGVNCGLF